MTDKPEKRHMQRAAAYYRACAMATFCCAVHKYTDDRVNRTTLDGLSEAQIKDTVGVLGRMLAEQMGAPVTVKETPTAAEAWTLAGQVAANSDNNVEMFIAAMDRADGRTKRWAAAQAHKPEDNPDWN